MCFLARCVILIDFIYCLFIKYYDDCFEKYKKVTIFSKNESLTYKISKKKLNATRAVRTLYARHVRALCTP